MTRKNIIARTVSSNNKIVSSRFFEQSQFEQMIMSLFHLFSTFFFFCLHFWVFPLSVYFLSVLLTSRTFSFLVVFFTPLNLSFSFFTRKLAKKLSRLCWFLEYHFKNYAELIQGLRILNSSSLINGVSQWFSNWGVATFLRVAKVVHSPITIGQL